MAVKDAGRHVVVIGGGLSGLACSYEMAKQGIRVTTLEREGQVGGMATSFEEGDRATAGEADSDYWSHDFGPHRFHTDETELLQHIQEILADNQVWRRRLSRIFLFDRFFDYPLEFSNVLRNMPPGVIARILIDYAWVRVQDLLGLADYRDRNFSEWVERRFGRTLSKLFFVEYTEKAWGIAATNISSSWASQRITLLNLTDTILKTLFKPRKVPRTLVTEFVYPEVGGIGELARGYEERITSLGGTVVAGAPAIRVHCEGSRVVQVEYRKQGETHLLEADHFISTVPITELARSIRPKPPTEVLQAARSLEFISTVFVYLKLDRDAVSRDHWIYLPGKDLRVHRVSEFKNFSPKAAPAGKTMVCCEITCRAGDDIWRADEHTLTDIAAKDLASIGLIRREEVIGSHVRRIPFSYPLYDLEYEEHLKPVLEFIRSLENLETGGRQGLFRYNNMDQSIKMGRLMAAGLLGEGAADHELVATEQQYFG